MNSWRYALVFFLLAATALFIQFYREVAVPVARPLEEIPRQFEGWRLVDETHFSTAVLAQLRPTDYLYREYVDATGARVTLYLGYHAGGPDSGPIHSPKHCLPGSGWRRQQEEARQMVLTDGRPLRLVTALYRSGACEEFFVYWFQVKGATLTNEYALKLAELINALRYRRRDSAFIRISVPVTTDVAAAEQLALAFVADFYPAIQAVLPQ